MQIKKLFLLISFVLVFLAGVTSAQTPTPTEANKELKSLPKSGLISFSDPGGSMDQSADLPVGGIDTSGNEIPPITGSMNRGKERQWIAVVANNTKESTISANFEARQIDKNGTLIKSDPFSEVLSPGERKERILSGSSRTVSTELQLVSWKDLTVRKASPTPTSVPPTPGPKKKMK